MELNETHDPSAHSWLASANLPECPFPPQNLPLARVLWRGAPRVAVALGDQAVVLDEFDSLLPLGDPRARAELRLRLFQGACNPESDLRQAEWVAQTELHFLLPFEVGDYTDFYASIHHARRVGALFRPDAPLLPNYPWVPIGYHGRASSLVVSGTPVARPAGQQAGAEAPRFGPSEALDYELELGFWVGTGNALGQPVPIASAGDHWMGVSLVNDWSARDLQRWEYQPLGPFLAKSFATSVSPWVVTREALAPFTCSPAERPRPLDYLVDPDDVALDLELEAWLRPSGGQAACLSRCQFREMFWTPAQLLTHHASNGCPLRPGDLLASGTVSDAQGMGCLLELTQGGRQPVELAPGIQRRYLEDGDEVRLTGWARRPGRRTLGLGECRGKVTT